MSKLFNVSDEERNRILSLHESAIKKQYLSEESIKYVVKQDDTLSKIAAKYKTTVKDIASNNNISNIHAIRVGQTLTIPSDGSIRNSKDNENSKASHQKNTSLPDTTPNLPFKNREEGNKFREWVNDNYPATARKLQLSRSGSHKNSYILNAFNYNIQLPNGRNIKLGEFYNSKTSNQKNTKKNNIKIISGMNPNLRIQMNFDKLSTTKTTKGFCTPNDKHCAQFVNDLSDDIKFVGNAWSAYLNDSNLGETIYSAFKNLNSSQISDAIKYWQEIDKRPGEQKWEIKGPLSEELQSLLESIVPKKYNGPTLKAGDVVGIFYPGSKNQERAFYEGAKASKGWLGKGWFVNGKPGKLIQKGEGWGMNSHVGIVAVEKDDVPLIFHNVEGTVKSDPPKNLRIAWVKRKQS